MKKFLFAVMILCLSLVMFGCQMNAQNDDAKDLVKIYNELFEGVDLEHVASNLTFVTEKDGVTIVYDSRNKAVLSDLGVVTRPDADTTIDLVVTLTYGDKTYQGKFTITILAKEHVHQYGDWQKDDNNHWKECSCGDKQELAAHTWNEGVETKAPTEQETGEKTFTCTVCGATKVEILEKLAHTHQYGDWLKDENNHWKECSCGEKAELAAHTWNEGVETKAPTEQEKGEKTFTCTICGATKVEELDKLAHTHQFGDWLNNEENHWKECSCGEKAELAAHTWDDGNVTLAPTLEAEGIKTFTCTVCGAIKTEVINKLDPENDDEQTIVIDIEEYATANNWVDAKSVPSGETAPQYLEVSKDGVTITVSGKDKGNYGKYYAKNDYTAVSTWRFYSAEDSKLTFSSESNIVSIKVFFVFNEGKQGAIQVGSNVYNSEDEILVNDKTITLAVVTAPIDENKNGQIHITKIEVVLGSYSGGGDDPVNPPVEYMTVAEVYELAQGAEINALLGVVTGFMAGNNGDYNVYIADETGDVLVFFKGIGMPEGLEVGQEIVVNGSLDIYKGLYEVKVLDLANVTLGEVVEFAELDIDDLSELDDSWMSAVINLNNVKLSSVELAKKDDGSNKDTTLVLADEKGNEFPFFVKAAHASLFNRVFANVKAGELISIKNVVVSVYNTTVQICLTEQVEVTGGSDNPDNPPVEVPEDLQGLADLWNRIDWTNYTFRESLAYDGEVDHVDSYEVDGEYVHWITRYTSQDGSDAEEEYYILMGEDEDGYYTFVGVIFFDEDSEAWYYSEDLYDIYACLYYYNLDYYGLVLDFSKFEKVEDDKYQAKADYVNEVGKAFFYDCDGEFEGEEEGDVVTQSEVFSSFIIEVQNGSLAITATSTYTYEDEEGKEEYACVYNIQLKDINTTSFDVPEYVVEEEELTIADVYEMENKDEVNGMYGVVTGFMPGNRGDYNVYVTDGQADILVFFKSIGLPEGLQVGQEILVNGTVSIYKGMVEVVVTSFDDIVLGEVIGFEELDINDLSQLSEEWMGTVVNLVGVSFESLELGDGDTSLTVVDKAGNEMVLFVKSAQAEIFNSIFAGVEAGSEINLKNVAVSVFNTVQLVLTEQTEVNLEYGLILSYNSKVITEGVALEEALADLVVSYRNEAGELAVLEDGEYTISCEEYNMEQGGTYTVLISYNEETISLKLILSIPSVLEGVEYQTLAETAVEKVGYNVGLPSTGDVNVLVIPVAFSNSDLYNYGTEDEIKAKLEIAFNGTNEETGWYSLRGYYQTVSYGRLNLHAEILDIFDSGLTYDVTKGKTGVVDYDCFLRAIEAYDDEIDYSLYDQNEDGYIDCVYLVYLAPYYDYYDENQSDLWWAYCWEYFEELEDGQEETTFDGVGLDYYLWFSMDFLDDPIDAIYDRTGDIIEEESLYVNINCETIIHESGHALGLDDYYDYADGGVTGGVGGFAMMDYNQGDHDPYSKAILGWINPIVVANMDYSATLASFAETGDTIIISKNNGGTYFEEYFMIALYTPTGVNELKSDRECGLPSEVGVMIWHIDASLRSDKELASGQYGPMDMTLCNNGKASCKLIDLVSASSGREIGNQENYLVSDVDLFGENSTVGRLTWYDGSSVGLTLSLGEFGINAETGLYEVSVNLSFN